MEKNINRDNFERLLREKTDEFRMYPSNRVWNSIYNNFHPSRKWPSVAMSIGLVTTLLLTGYLNTNNTHHKAVSKANNTTALAVQPASTPVEYGTVAVAHPAPAVSVEQSFKTHAPAANNRFVNTPVAGKKTTTFDAMGISSRATLVGGKKSATAEGTVLHAAITTSAPVKTETTTLSEKATVAFTYTPIAIAEELLQIDTEENEGTVGVAETISHTAMSMEKLSLPAVFNNENAYTTTTLTEKLIAQNTEIAGRLTGLSANTLTTEQKSWMEDYALHNRPAPKSWKGKLAWQAYAAPSVVYRQLYNNINQELAQQYGFTNRIYYSDIDPLITERPSWGLEAGTALQYSLLKWLKIKAGIQLNYTRYNIHAFENGHPNATSITMIDKQSNLPYEALRSTPYSNKYGLMAVKLHNQTLQLSLPLGADIRLAKLDNLEWYAGASWQPTLLLGGSAYLISSDRLSYIPEKSMMNRFNLNAAFETYLSYKTASGYTWQMGPQYRTQVFSTYNKMYSVGERLQNYSFKIGVSKNL
jgi:hypothetical protein